MRADQLEKLKALQEAQFDGMLEELEEPLVGTVEGDNGTAVLKPSQMMSQTERGNRYWQKKNVSASLVVATKIDLLRARLERASYLDASPVDDKGAEMSDANIDNEFNALAAKAQTLHDQFNKNRTKH